MKQALALSLSAFLVSGAVAGAQERQPTTTVKSDNGEVVTLVGCVMIGGGTGVTLTNITSERVQDDKVRAKPGPATAGSYSLTAREGLDLSAYLNHRVELSGVVVHPATRGDRDDKIEIKETDRPKGASGPAKQTVKIARGDTNQFLVAAVKTLSPSCDN